MQVIYEKGTIMPLSNLSLRHLLVTGLLVNAWFFQPTCYSQVATPAPVEESVISSNPQNAEDSIDDVPIPFLMEEAKDAYDKKNFSRAARLIEKAVVNSESEDESRNMKTLLAIALVSNQEHVDALHVLNDLIKSKPDPNLVLVRSTALFQAGWRGAALDELRRDQRLNPNNQQLRKVLADALLSSPIATGSEAAEALTALMPFEEEIADDPRIAAAIAMAAAGAENFELAIKMQKRYVGLLDSTQRQREAETLSRYEAKQYSNPTSFPTWDPAKLKSNKVLANNALRSMVMVRLNREMQLTEAVSGKNAGIASEMRTHFGTVLSSMGTILVSSNTVRMPRFNDHIHGVAGSVKLLSEQIELFTMPDDSGKSVSLGLAKVQGIDEPSGLAVLKVVHEKHFENVKYDELKTIDFMPEYRLLDPNTKIHLAKLYEYSVEKGSKTNKASLREVTADLSQYSAYHDRTMDGPTMARLAKVRGSHSLAGAPIFNQLGECVGITHEIGFDEAPRQVIIPSDVCTRVAAKLMANGVVHRASLPIVVGGIMTGVREPLMGMSVMKTTSKDPIFKSLEGDTIVGINGIPTPTLTEWLTVLERAYALDLKTLVLEIYDPATKGTSCMEIPVGS